MASRPEIRDLPLPNKLKSMLIKLGIEDLVDLGNSTPQELMAYDLSPSDIQAIVNVLPPHALFCQCQNLCQCQAPCQCVVASSNHIKFASEDQAFQLLSNILKKKVKIANKEFKEGGNLEAIKKTVRDFEESDDWDKKQEVLDSLFVDVFPFKRKFGVDKYSFGIEKMIVQILDELSKVWKKYESDKARVDLFNQAIEATKKFAEKLGYRYSGPPTPPKSHGIIKLPGSQKLEEYSMAASKQGEK